MIQRRWWIAFGVVLTALLATTVTACSGPALGGTTAVLAAVLLVIALLTANAGCDEPDSGTTELEDPPLQPCLSAPYDPVDANDQSTSRDAGIKEPGETDATDTDDEDVAENVDAGAGDAADDSDDEERRPATNDEPYIGPCLSVSRPRDDSDDDLDLGDDPGDDADDDTGDSEDDESDDRDPFSPPENIDLTPCLQPSFPEDDQDPDDPREESPNIDFEDESDDQEESDDGEYDDVPAGRDCLSVIPEDTSVVPGGSRQKDDSSEVGKPDGRDERDRILDKMADRLPDDVLARLEDDYD